MWWKDLDGAYVNSAHVQKLDAVEVPASSGNWFVEATFTDGTQFRLAGTRASEAAALDAAQELTQGFDPSTI